MLFLAILAASLVASNAIVCFHGICDDIKKPDPLQCAGTVIKNGGFCGCYDVCAKVILSLWHLIVRSYIPVDRVDFVPTCLAIVNWKFANGYFCKM